PAVRPGLHAAPRPPAANRPRTETLTRLRRPPRRRRAAEPASREITAAVRRSRAARSRVDAKTPSCKDPQRLGSRAGFAERDPEFPLRDLCLFAPLRQLCWATDSGDLQYVSTRSSLPTPTHELPIHRRTRCRTLSQRRADRHVPDPPLSQLH